MLMAADTARADIALTADRTYYRFATETSIEQGELKPVPDFGGVAERLLAAAMPGDNESPLSAEVRMQLFADNRLQQIAHTEQSLKRVVDELEAVACEFAFLKGFVS